MLEPARKVYDLTFTDGWEAVRKFLELQVSSLTRRLTEEAFENLSEVSRLQGEITGYQKILGFVNNRVEQYEKRSES